MASSGNWDCTISMCSPGLSMGKSDGVNAGLKRSMLAGDVRILQMGIKWRLDRHQLDGPSTRQEDGNLEGWAGCGSIIILNGTVTAKLQTVGPDVGWIRQSGELTRTTSLDGSWKTGSTMGARQQAMRRSSIPLQHPSLRPASKTLRLLGFLPLGWGARAYPSNGSYKVQATTRNGQAE